MVHLRRLRTRFTLSTGLLVVLGQWQCPVPESVNGVSGSATKAQS
ncbi:hypothetical protein SAMN05661093_06476 [Kibdelosporangium aridum]|uniref:Uncharacterized protein n=1 Tax=Kibdelosporangium aridum TaxID=2030 RepID=A0A1Y5XZQ1_KIBAR|nr:hypothetical protein SAMN05661093_06476 [Kibdelosporangium aridum]